MVRIVDSNAKVIFVPLDHPRADDTAFFSPGASHRRLLLQVLDPGQSLDVTGAFPTRAGDLVLGHQITVCCKARFRKASVGTGCRRSSYGFGRAACL